MLEIEIMVRKVEVRGGRRYVVGKCPHIVLRVDPEALALKDRRDIANVVSHRARLVLTRDYGFPAESISE